MSIAYLDDALPDGLSASDLGESVSGTVAHLISLHPSPLTSYQVNGYVVLVPGSEIDYQYDWTIKRNNPPPQYERQGTTSIGRLHWRPPLDDNLIGSYTISVTLRQGNTETEKLELLQDVRPRDPDLEALRKVYADKLVPAGNVFAFRRILYDLFPYITSAASSTNGKISERYLASIVYSSINKVSNTNWTESLSLPSWRKLTGGRIRVMLDWGKTRLLNHKRLRGVCRLDPSLVAFSENLIQIAGDEELNLRRLRREYQQLDGDIKKDLTNRLRFPKQNIATTAALLVQYEEAWRAESQSSGSELISPDEMEDEDKRSMKRSMLATLLRMGGPSLTSRSSNEGKTQFSVPPRSFGVHVASAYRLPAMTVLVDPNQAVELRGNQWMAVNDNVKRHFAGKFVQYFYLARFYQEQHNIDDLAAWIDQNITRITFLGKLVDVHNDIAALLPEVERRLPNNISVTTIGGFSPRLIAGRQRLSNHAFGKAVDFDYSTNPHMFAKHIRALQPLAEAAGVPFSPGRQSTYAEMEILNAEFMNEFAISTDGTPGADWTHVSDAVFRDLTQWWMAGGIMTLPEELVEEMIIAGFGWGGHYLNSRDFMHFDYPPES